MGILTTVTRVLVVTPDGATTDGTHDKVGRAALAHIANARAVGLDDDEIEEDIIHDICDGRCEDAQILGGTVYLEAFGDGAEWQGWPEEEAV